MLCVISLNPSLLEITFAGAVYHYQLSVNLGEGDILTFGCPKLLKNGVMRTRPVL